MGHMEINCPGCKQRKSLSPGTSYKVCDRCATPHCIFEGGNCRVSGCHGWLKEVRNP